MDDRRDADYRRDIDSLGYPADTPQDTSWTVPAIIVTAILIIGGYFVVSYNGDNVRTANNMPAAERSAPAPVPGPPPPTTPPTQPTQ